MNPENIIRIQLANVELPDCTEVRTNSFVKFGTDNLYPQYLTSLYDRSSKHAAIINNKVTYIMGNGLSTKEDNPIAKKFIDEHSDLVEEICFDVEKYGASYIQVIKDYFGKPHYFHLNYENVRSNKTRTIFYYKNNWKDRSENWVTLPAYSPKEKNSIYLIIEKGNTKIYARPQWKAAINNIEADIEVSKHILTNAVQGFSPSKHIVFRNGTPEKDVRKEIEEKFKNKYGGSNGDKIVISFIEPNEEHPDIQDLGASDLTKEDFAAQNNLIAENIFIAHSVTHPLLFGMQVAGKLGNASELKTAYDIFRKTYASKKQNFLINEVSFLYELKTKQKETFFFIEVDPIGVQITENVLLKAAPRSWILEQMAIDTTKYNDAPVEVSQPAQLPQQQQVKQEAQSSVAVNDNIKNLTAKQHQQLLRIIRQYTKGQLTKQQATLLLKTGLGLTEEEAISMLGTGQQFNKQSFFSQENTRLTKLYFEAITSTDEDTIDAFANDEDVANVFLAFGEDSENYDVVLSKKAEFKNNDEALAISEAVSKIDKATKNIPKFLVMYTYEKRPEASGATLLPTSRPFCIKMIGANKMFSRQDIQKISQLLGYDVFNRAGGFWNNNGKIETHCRHEFRSNVVIKKR